MKAQPCWIAENFFRVQGHCRIDYQRLVGGS